MSEERTHGIFIDVEVSDEASSDVELGRKLEEVCPVDIYEGTEEGPRVVPENLDECVLCRLCLEASPPGAVTVHKLYDGTTLD